jgi:hypothetical protein
METHPNIYINKKKKREARNEYRKIVYVNAKLYVAHTMRASTAFLCSFCDHGASTRKWLLRNLPSKSRKLCDKVLGLSKTAHAIKLWG